MDVPPNFITSRVTLKAPQPGPAPASGAANSQSAPRAQPQAFCKQTLALTQNPPADKADR
jgi:hypothetical protein